MGGGTGVVIGEGRKIPERHTHRHSTHTHRTLLPHISSYSLFFSSVVVAAAGGGEGGGYVLPKVSFDVFAASDVDRSGSVDNNDDNDDDDDDHDHDKYDYEEAVVLDDGVYHTDDTPRTRWGRRPRQQRQRHRSELMIMIRITDTRR